MFGGRRKSFIIYCESIRFRQKQKQKHSPRRHEGHEVFNALNLNYCSPFVSRQLLSYMDVMNAENAGAFFCPALLNHWDVAAAIAPGNLAAFPPSLEASAAYAGAVFCLPFASMQVVRGE